MPQDIWDWISMVILASGYGGAFAIQVSGLIHQRAYHLLPIQVLLPALLAAALDCGDAGGDRTHHQAGLLGQDDAWA